MKDIKDIISEAYMRTANSDDRAFAGNVLEVEMIRDGKFYWHTAEDNDWSKFQSMKDWEIYTDEMPKRFFIKIGKK